MSKMFRLKKAAIPFYSDKFADKVRDMHYWNENNVNQKALEEVKYCFVVHGHEIEGEAGLKYTSLHGWSNDDGAEFKFILRMPSMSHKDFQIASTPEAIRELMESIEDHVNRLF